jgi:hypothetical protein
MGTILRRDEAVSFCQKRRRCERRQRGTAGGSPDAVAVRRCVRPPSPTLIRRRRRHLPDKSHEPAPADGRSRAARDSVRVRRLHHRRRAGISYFALVKMPAIPEGVHTCTRTSPCSTCQTCMQYADSSCNSWETLPCTSNAMCSAVLNSAGDWENKCTVNRADDYCQLS